MNTSEFKAWFEGFTEGLEKAPSEKQWKRIKERVKDIKSEAATSYPVFVDRYVKPYYERYPNWPITYVTCGSTTSLSSIAQNSVSNTAISATKTFDMEALGGSSAVGISSLSMGEYFARLGRMDAQALEAGA